MVYFYFEEESKKELFIAVNSNLKWYSNYFVNFLPFQVKLPNNE